jgi:hypothetical protein
MRNNEPARAIGAADQALDLAEHLGLERLVAETFNNKGSSLGYLGRPREGEALLRAAVEVARAGGFVAAEIRAMSNLGASIDSARHARDAYRGAEELARRVGNRSLARWASEAARYQDFIAADGWDAALAKGADDRDDDPGSVLDGIRRLAVSALFLAARGESTDAAIARLEVLSTEVSDPYGQSSLHYLRSDRALRAGDYAHACDEAILAARDESLARSSSRSMRLAPRRPRPAQGWPVSRPTADRDAVTASRTAAGLGSPPRRLTGDRDYRRRFPPPGPGQD